MATQQASTAGIWHLHILGVAYIRLSSTGYILIIFRIGFRMPMLLGCGLNLLATLCFAYLRNFSLLVMTRALQALGSSFSVVGGKKFNTINLSGNQLWSLMFKAWHTQSKPFGVQVQVLPFTYVTKAPLQTVSIPRFSIAGSPLPVSLAYEYL